MTDRKPILRLKRPRQTDVDRPQPTRKVTRKVLSLVKPPVEDDLLADLQVIAPEVWDPSRPVPLAVGIHAQINPVAEARGMSRRAVRRFLGRWTSNAAYLCALSQPGAQRVNVDGSRAEEVLERHRGRARRRLERRSAATVESTFGGPA